MCKELVIYNVGLFGSFISQFIFVLKKWYAYELNLEFIFLKFSFKFARRGEKIKNISEKATSKCYLYVVAF